jgi:ribosome-associated protein
MSPSTATTATSAAALVPDSAFVAAAAADDKLGEDTVVLAMAELLGVVDAFVVTSGRNDRQVRALVEEVERRVKDHDGTKPMSVEGLADATWVLMDYGDFVVHVFADETRGFYDLEHLWAGAPRVPWQEAGSKQGSGRDGITERSSN